jgi:hypothetical protein
VIVHADSPGVSVQEIARRPAVSDRGILQRGARTG